MSTPRSGLAIGWPAGAVLGFLLALAFLAQGAPSLERPSATASPNLPLYFVENRGQLPDAVRAHAHGATAGVYFLQDRVRLAVNHGPRADAVDLSFIRASGRTSPELQGHAAAHVTYLQSGSRDTLSTYREVVYRDVWPNIDAVFKGAGGKLEYSFVLRPGADPDDVRLEYRGANRIAVTRGGDLLVKTPGGAFRDMRPRAYQHVDGLKRRVSSRFALRGQTHYGFDVDTYDRSAPLVIDPGIAYAALLPARAGGSAGGIAVDGKGSAYVVGEATTGFPTTPGSYDQTANGFRDAFVSKFSADGSTLVYSTFIGGTSGSSRAFDVEVDQDGMAYLVGDTTSPNFPTTAGAFDRAYNTYEAFVSKLSPDGSRLEYSTFFGGAGNDNSQGEETDTAFGIDIDALGNAYVAGNTASESIPLSPGAVITDVNVDSGFVFKLNPEGSALLYSTYLGSTHYGSIDVAADTGGNAYVSGEEIFEDVPVTPGAFDTQGPARFESPDDAYSVKLSPDATSIVYGTYLGGTRHDRGFRIAVNQRGEATVLGDTESPDFPTTPGAHATTRAGDFDAFVTRLNAAGSALVYSTYLGGTSYDGGSAMGIDLDHADRALVTGRTTSNNFPLTADAPDRTRAGSDDAFLTALDPQGRLSYSTYLPGGTGAEYPFGLAVDQRGDAYATGETFSSNYPTTPGAFGEGSTTAGIFAVKVDLPPSDPATLTLAPEEAVNPVDAEHCVSATVRDQFGAPSTGLDVVFEVSGANRARGTSATDTTGVAEFCYTGELPGNDRIAAFADFNPHNDQQDGFAFPPEPGDEVTKTWALPDSCNVKVNGAGWIVAANGDRATFQANLRARTHGGASGNLRYSDRGPEERLEFRQEEIVGVGCSPSGAVTVFGVARVNGQPGVSFRVELEDEGAPGAGRDSYRLLLETGYDSGRHLLIRGNIKVH